MIYWIKEYYLIFNHYFHFDLLYFLNKYKFKFSEQLILFKGYEIYI